MIQKSTTEDTIEEIHRIRQEISDRFGGDLAAIAADAARRQAESGRPVWRPGTTNKAMHPSGGGTASDSGQSNTAAG
jgi:hypothetical protein